MGYLATEDIEDGTLRGIYATMRGLYDRHVPIDIVACMDAGHDVEILAELSSAGFAQNCRHHAKVVKTASSVRKARKQAEQIINGITAQMFDSPDDVHEWMNGQVTNGHEHAGEVKERFEDVLDDVCNQLEQDKLNVTTPMKFGMYDLDWNTGGLRNSELTLIAAGPGIGKTAFAMNIAVNVARTGKKVLLISREMNRIQVAKRVIANLATVEAESIRDGRTATAETWEGISKVLSEAPKLDIRINDKLATIQHIYNRCKRMKEKNDIDLLIIDYLQLLQSSTKHESRRHEIEYISRQLKLMSLELAIPIIALSQMSREGRKGQKPNLFDLRESGALEQDADNVIFIHDPKEADNREEQKLDIDILVMKQRNGRTGVCHMRFDKRYQRFSSLER
jgi:replicative DNA helicase